MNRPEVPTSTMSVSFHLERAFFGRRWRAKLDALCRSFVPVELSINGRNMRSAGIATENKESRGRWKGAATFRTWQCRGRRNRPTCNDDPFFIFPTCVTSYHVLSIYVRSAVLLQFFFQKDRIRDYKATPIC